MDKKYVSKSEVNENIILQNYMLERLLERISVSKYKYKFVLKGGMLITAIVGIDMRNTLDMDATIKGFDLEKDNLENILDNIFKIDLNDGVTFEFKEIKEIRQEDEYGGYRVSLDAKFDKLIVPMKLDITTGDVITPKEIKYKFDLMFEERSVEILAYNMETVIADKFETIISRNVLKKVKSVGKILKVREVGDPILNENCKMVDIKNINESILDTIEDLKATLKFSSGMGIAAPQIGINKRIIVVGAKKENIKYNEAEEIPVTVMINPSWEKLSEETDIQYEGCMSVPSIRGRVERYKKIKLKYYNTGGSLVEREISGFFARLVQHECDHLDGIVFLVKVKEPNGFSTKDNIIKYNLRDKSFS